MGQIEKVALIYIPPCVKYTASGKLLCREPSSVLCYELDGWGWSWREAQREEIYVYL